MGSDETVKVRGVAYRTCEACLHECGADDLRAHRNMFMICSVCAGRHVEICEECEPLAWHPEAELFYCASCDGFVCDAKREQHTHGQEGPDA